MDVLARYRALQALYAEIGLDADANAITKIVQTIERALKQ
jgi:hypothetical protein